MRAARRQLASTALALLAGCVDKTPFSLVRNTCVTNADCAEIGTVCDTERQQCIRETVEEPYQVFLQVRPKPGSAELPEGESLVDQETYPAFLLRRAIPDNPLEVPLLQQVTARVVRLEGEEKEAHLVAAEVSFTLADPTLPVSSTPIVEETRTIPGDDLNNLKVSLNPNAQYKVSVKPLYKEDGRTLAPFTADYPGGKPGVIEVPEMVQSTGVLRADGGAILPDHRIRLEHKLSGAILSSTDTTDENGKFELYAPRTVMDEQSFNVVVSLKPFPLWRVKVAVDGSRLVPNVVLTIPKTPDVVKYEGSVEAKTSEGKGEPAAYADLVFSSRFPIPAPDGDPRGKDWCRRSAAGGPAPLCTAHIAATSDASGKFAVELLPGYYDVFTSPSSETRDSTALSTTWQPANVLSHSADDAVEGNSFALERAIHFEGIVRSRGGEPMPNVRVSARPLALPGPTINDEVNEEVYKYARPAAAITARRGTFELDVDRGYFDLTVEPPGESGFAWLHSLNRVVRNKPERPVRPLEPRAPVPVSGVVQHEGMPLPGATVEAFALITGEPGGQRAVRIAQTVTDDNGHYRLALPPAVRARDPEQDAGVDAEADAGHSE